MPDKYEGSSFADIAMDYRRTGKIFTDKVDELLDFTKIERKLKKKYTRNVSADGRPAYPPFGACHLNCVKS